jgi:hypothetical protein
MRREIRNIEKYVDFSIGKLARLLAVYASLDTPVQRVVRRHVPACICCPTVDHLGTS